MTRINALARQEETLVQLLEELDGAELGMCWVAYAIRRDLREIEDSIFKLRKGGNGGEVGED
jgi:hypothetical protein